MSTSSELTTIAISSEAVQIDWITDSLKQIGRVIPASSEGLEEILALIEATGSSLIFVGLNRSNVMQRSLLIEGILGARPMVSVVAVGEGMDNNLMLAAMRAGARDYISFGVRPSEVAGLVRRLSSRLPVAVATHQTQSDLVVLYNARPDPDAALIALHLAQAFQEAGDGKVLLLDLGQPRGEALAILNAHASFSFEDAVRNLRRLDATLIDSAFTQTPSGLQVLSLEDPYALSSVAAAEFYLMLSTLRSTFKRIVVNLAGAPECELTYKLVGNASRLLWMVDQSVASCQQNLAVLQHLQQAVPALPAPELLIDSYVSGVAPDEVSLEKTFKPACTHILSASPEARLKAKNFNQSLFEVAPRDSLTRTLRSIAGGNERKRSFVERLFKR